MQKKREVFDIDTLMTELLKATSTSHMPSQTTEVSASEQCEETEPTATPKTKHSRTNKQNASAVNSSFPVPVIGPDSKPKARAKQPKKRPGDAFVVKKCGNSGKKEIVAGPGIPEKYKTPDMDTPLSSLGMRKDLLEALNRVNIMDVGDLCMIRKNGLERYHILCDADLSALCAFMEKINISLT